MYNLCRRSRFFIQNPAKCGIYDEDIFTENNTETPELQGEEDVPTLVRLAEKGSFESIKALLDVCPPQQKTLLVNAEDKGTGDTALSAAAKQGHLNIVGTLLVEGADPTVENITLQGDRKSAKAGLEGQIGNLENMMENIISGDHYIYDKDAWKESEEVIVGILEKHGKMRKCLNLIKLAEKSWKKGNVEAKKGNVETKTRMPKMKVFEKIQAKILKFLKREDEGDGKQKRERERLSEKRLVESYNKILLEKRFDILSHQIKQKKRNFGA